MAPALQMYVAIIAAVLMPTLTSAFINGTLYAVTVSSQLTGESMDKLCVQLDLPIKLPCPICLKVKLQISNQKKKTLIVEEGITSKLSKCFDFLVPKVKTRTVATISVDIGGDDQSVIKETKVVIVPPTLIHLLRSDKPIYKPGQTIRFRIVSLDTDFLPVKRNYTLIELVDADSNRIGQWLGLLNTNGILDLSHLTDPEAMTGTYTIAALTDKGEKITHSFKVDRYVLPKFEVRVSLPSVVTYWDKEVTFKVCGKYTYGKPVTGTVKAVFCKKGYRYYWIPLPKDESDCKTFQLRTDKSGCASQVVKMEEFYVHTNYMSIRYFEVTAELMESGTGSIQSGSGKMNIRNLVRMLSFMDLPPNYKPDLTFDGRVKLTGPDDKPVANEEVFLSVNNVKKQTLTTDSQGMAKFSLDTKLWKDSVTLTAQAKEPEDVKDIPKTLPYNIRPIYGSAYHRALRFYSKSNSFVKLLQAGEDLPCDSEAELQAQFIINEEELMQGQDTIKFFYLVVSKGGIKQDGYIEAPVAKKVGEMSLILSQIVNLAPVAQVIVYTVLPSGEMVADSMDFRIEHCFKNKVSLKFPRPQQLPAQETNLRLEAEPGSLCSVRAIDLSILLLEQEQGLTADYVYSQLPVQKLSGYSYDIEDFNRDSCHSPPFPFPIFGPIPRVREPAPELPEPEIPLRVLPEASSQPVRGAPSRQRRSFIFPPYGSYERNDVYSVFKEMGVKILTNMDVDKPCPKTSTTRIPGRPEGFGGAFGGRENFLAAPAAAAPEAPLATGAFREKSQAEQETVRSFFPETWIWDLVTVGDDGLAKLDKTVPDTITKWVAGAFCVSPVGFGVSPNTGLTAFKPFFVSLTLPFSVTRGESFTLRATVFSYLPKCIALKATLAKSDQYTFKDCDGCHSACLCAGESKTFAWPVTPTAIGQLNFEVSAEALNDTSLCGSQPTIVPAEGKTDTVVRKLLVEAEGTPQQVNYNFLLCHAGKSVEEQFSLVLPENFVEGSVKASVSVLGDLMGRALKNIDKLLQMPYGCGEQNMLKFAPNVYILQYLQSTGQLTDDILLKATPFLEGGYQRELTYKHKDGSYSAFGERDKSGNTWLTAFVMMSFGEAKDFIFVDENIIDLARRWLSNQQNEDGCIQSVGKLFHNAMKGGVRDEVTLTAYVIAAMLELKVKTSDPVVKNGLGCLKTALEGEVDNLYATALMAYTFTLAKDEAMRTKLIKKLDSESTTAGGTRHWVRPGASTPGLDSLEVETTSYALLALLSGPTLPDYKMGYSATVAQWLVKQQNAFGGFSSTQDTVVALKALSKYAAATYSKEGPTSVTVSSKGGHSSSFIVNHLNRLLLQEESLTEVPGEYTVKAEGMSCVLVQASMSYNTPPSPVSPTFNISIRTLSICNSTRPQLFIAALIRYQGRRTETNMVILDIKLLSGYTVVQKSVDELLENGIAKRVDVTDGHIKLYLEELQYGMSMLYQLTIEGDKELGFSDMKPALVKIYDYYDTRDEAFAEYTSVCE